ncbi:MAG: hypothetical protein RL199_583 [Pseudomonadota bacterium]|jgi:hypothetical protein
MPTPHHDALVELFRLAPRQALAALSRVLPIPIPAGARVDAIDPSVRELANTEHRADAVLKVAGRHGRAVIVVEVQRRRVKAKKRRWPRYVASLWDEHGMPVCLLVLATEEAVAAWAREPIHLGPGSVVTPVVIAPGDVPWLDELPVDERTSPVILLNAALHVRTMTDYDRFAASVPARRRRGDAGIDNEYDAWVFAALPGAVRRGMEVRMRQGFKDPLYERIKAAGFVEGIEKGIEKGRVEGALRASRDLFLRLAASRGWRLGPAERRRIESCNDAETLAAWAERVLTSSSLRDALAS